MRRTATVAIIVGWMLAITTTVQAVELEPDVTWDHDNHICWEASGEQGIITFDGQCMTPTDYDTIYSFESLSQIPTVQACWPGTSCGPDAETIAEAYGMVDDGVAASDRPLGVGLVEPGTETTFREKVSAAHAVHLPIPA